MAYLFKFIKVIINYQGKLKQYYYKQTDSILFLSALFAVGSYKIIFLFFRKL
jgi:hypothetical protein